MVPLVARYTWARQWPSSAFEGLSFGILGLATFAARRSLGAPEFMVALLIALWQVTWILSPAVGTLMARSDPRRLFRWIALVAFVPVLLIAGVTVEPAAKAGHGAGNLPLFVGLLFFYYAALVAYVPHRGALLRANYPRTVRGRMFGLLTAVSFLAAAVSAKSAAFMLDRDPRWLRLLFPLAGASGMIGALLLARIRWRRQRRVRRHHAVAENPFAAMRRAWSEAIRILRQDREFRTYEIGFMIYGCGFLWSIGLLVLYAEGDLGLSYNEYTWAQFVTWPLGQIAAAPLFGRISDRLGIVRTTALAFVILACFFGVMPLVGSAAGLAGAFLLFGVAMAGVNIGWNLGPLHFAPDHHAHMYMALHFSLVGVRSLFAPFLGWVVKDRFSYAVAFGVSVALLLVAAGTLLRLARRVS